MNVEVKRLFEGAVQLPSEERPAFLAQRCPDPAIRLEVESLLQYATGAETLLDASIREAAWSMHTDGGLSTGDRVGAYQIVTLIGQGGMGTVYLAQRVDGAFQQQVAVKVLQLGNSELLLERFWRERRILAHLSHPNIARIIDAGQTSNGLPWFAMEYIPGRTIDEFCDQRNLTLRATLELFLQVCEAVRHAHQRLIVHRDLKPANIFVTAGGEPKLLDFGIAKVLDPGQMDNGSTRILTPEYASPEQIRGDAITTATDIYSLGAVLYTLVTGRPPHCLSDLAPLSAARIITEEEAPRASTLRPDLPADVDAILQKALHKDAARRYQSVEEFAHDIGKYLQGRPVLAAPDSLSYRARRFFRRNALITGMSALAALFLIAGTLVSIYQANRAQRRFQQVRQLANVFLFDFERSIENVPGTLEARRLVASTAQRYLEQLASDSGRDAGLQREIAAAYERLAEIQSSLPGQGNEMQIDGLRRAYEIRRRLGDDRASDAVVRKEFIRLASRLAARYQINRNTAESAKWDEEATRLAELWVRVEPASLDALEGARAAFLQKGLRLEAAGKAALSRASMDRSVLFGERARSLDPSRSDPAFNMAVTEYTFANMLLNLKQPDEARLHAQRAVALSEPLYRAAPATRKFRAAYEHSLSSAGIVYRALSNADPRQLPVAVDFLERAYSLAREAAQADPRNAGDRDNLVVQCHRLARALTQSGRLSKASALYMEAGGAIRELTGRDPQNRRNWYLAANNSVSLGDLLLEQRLSREAREVLESADESFDRGLALDPLDATLLEARASQLELLAKAAANLGEPQAARARMQECLAVLAAMIDRDASAKEYVGDYKEMITLAHRLGVSTGRLPEP